MTRRRIFTAPLVARLGAPLLAPENTLPSIRKAAEAGARFAEIDVTLTADGCLVMFHGDTVERTTDGRGAVVRITLAEIRALDARALVRR